MNLASNLFASRAYLVIDDFGEMRNMIKGLLRILGASNIDAARDAKEALAMIDRVRYDVILCDYNLGGGKSGQQLLEELRHRQLIDMSTVFVMITAENARDMVMAVVEYEPDGYLFKPFSKELLGTRLSKLFERKADLSPIFATLRRLDYSKALELVEERIARNPRNLAHLVRLKAEICQLAGNHEEAKKIYESLLNERDIPWARLGLGKVQFEQKAFTDAAENFGYLVQNHQTLMGAYDWLAKSQVALGFAKDAQTTLRHALRLSPHVMNRQQALGELAMQNQDFELAESALSRAAELSKYSIYNNPQLHANLAKSKSANSKHQEALQVAEGIGRMFDSLEASFYATSAQAQIHKSLGDDTAAQDCMQKAEETQRALGKGAPPDIALELARTAAQLGNAERAQQILRTAIRNNHDDEEFLSRATAVFRETGLGDDPTAMVHAIRLEVMEMNNHGVRLINEGQIGKAIELFTEAAESMTGNLAVNLNAARALLMKMEKEGAESGTLGMARKYIERSREISPSDGRLNKVLKRYQKLVGAG
jgi:tetratricopeptide (TPR) repeat protein